MRCSTSALCAAPIQPSKPSTTFSSSMRAAVGYLARRSRLGGERIEAPLGHVTDRWRRLVLEGRKDINASMYEVAAFEALNNGLRSGDLYALGSRHYQTFESYLLANEHWSQLKETGQTRLT